MRVAVCQLNSRDDRAANLAEARRLLEQAAAAGADFAVLPEFVDYLGRRRGEPEPETVDGEFAQFFSRAARELELTVLAGSFRERAEDGERAYNTSLVFDRSGRRVAAYRKIHLYDVEIPGRVSYHESKTIAPGEELVVADVEGTPVGLSICYDLRFPELYRALAVAGARVLVVPAAFMAHTGRDHWEVLLRARAIENQCYVVAAGQIGDHEPGRTCFGRSMVIDPWGTVVAQAPDVVGVVTADLDLGRLEDVRAELPSLANRRLPDQDGVKVQVSPSATAR
ncbi:carbon-nitrogen hydrolase family protein [Cryptosporangium arvum]|uniref:Putative amidohydrolase n=1 Tax=Cryptosporangium arvum DSM 44712 TaxID=927661 RepID=A0A010YYS5_9ACTN|nr:carbon-nitrogen hydrolase family protein [Cryptosporangium arvum]EXG80373.1 putative amidohydrolase [Cryptosporangium arvum DSM 44712]